MIGSPEGNPPWSLTRVLIPFSRERIVFQAVALEGVGITLTGYPTPCANTYSKWIKDLTVNAKVVNIQPWISQRFLRFDTKDRSNPPPPKKMVN